MKGFTYRKLSDYLWDTLHKRVRKIAVNAGLGCPNRDGSIGTGGCIYCNNASFNPRYAHESKDTITNQLEKGIQFNSRKGTPDGYLAYFQSYTNTYGKTERLISLYEEALAYPGVIGLVIATRPDCISEELLEWMKSKYSNGNSKPFIMVEIGVESTKDSTLAAINRGHDWECAKKAIITLAECGVSVGAHIILGLPGENRNDMIQHAELLSELPINTLKLHQLQVIKGTPLAGIWEKNPEILHLFTAYEYAELLKEFVAHLRPDIALDRFVSETPQPLLLAPRWGLKPSEFEKLLLL